MNHPFESFPKISRLSGLSCVITEKIDGTNAQVFISNDGDVLAGSRNRWVTPEDDNYGFASWVETNEQDLRQLGPGRHFGEWWGSGIQRRYGLNEKRFSLFNTGRWSTERPSCCGVVPVLYAGLFSMDAIQETLGRLKETGSIAAPGFMDPEGVVVFIPKVNIMFKRTYDGDKHKVT